LIEAAGYHTATEVAYVEEIMTKHKSNLFIIIAILASLSLIVAAFIACGDDDDDDSSDGVVDDDDDDDDDDDNTTPDDDDDTIDDDADTGDDDTEPTCTFLNGELDSEWYFDGVNNVDPPEIYQASATITHNVGECTFLFVSAELDLGLNGTIDGLNFFADWSDQEIGEFFELEGTLNAEGTYVEGTVSGHSEGEDIDGTFTLDKQK